MIKPTVRLFISDIRCVLCTASFWLCVLLLGLLYCCAPYQIPNASDSVTLFTLLSDPNYGRYLGSDFDLTAYGAFLNMQQVPWGSVFLSGLCVLPFLQVFSVQYEHVFHAMQIRTTAMGYTAATTMASICAALLCIVCSRAIYAALVYAIFPSDADLLRNQHVQSMYAIYGESLCERLQYCGKFLINDTVGTAIYGVFTVWLYTIIRNNLLVVSVSCLLQYGSIKLLDAYSLWLFADKIRLESNLLTGVQLLFPSTHWELYSRFTMETGLRFAWCAVILSVLLVLFLICLCKQIRRRGVYSG